MLYGKGGADALYGLAGNDRFFPGPGKDRVFCGPGVDRVQADRLDVVAKDCEIVSRPAAPAPTSPTTLEPAPVPVPIGSTRANPVSIGNAFSLGNGWTLRVDGITADATAIVLARNQFNDPPAAGNQFFIATVTVTNVSSSDTHFWDAGLRVIGAANVPYSPFTHSCGVIPNDFVIDGDEAFPGGTITRNQCWEVPSSDVGALQMYFEPLGTGSRVFFALR